MANDAGCFFATYDIWLYQPSEYSTITVCMQDLHTDRVAMSELISVPAFSVTAWDAVVIVFGSAGRYVPLVTDWGVPSACIQFLRWQGARGAVAPPCCPCPGVARWNKSHSLSDLLVKGCLRFSCAPGEFLRRARGDPALDSYGDGTSWNSLSMTAISVIVTHWPFVASPRSLGQATLPLLPGHCGCDGCGGVCMVSVVAMAAVPPGSPALDRQRRPVSAAVRLWRRRKNSTTSARGALAVAVLRARLGSPFAGRFGQRHAETSARRPLLLVPCGLRSFVLSS